MCSLWRQSAVWRRLSLNGIIYTDETDKANILNDFFQRQTVLNEENAVLPDLTPPASIVTLESIVFADDEVEFVLKLLSTGKVSGPDGLSNGLSNELAKPYPCLFNQTIHMGTVPSSYKEANVSPVPEKGYLSIVSTYRSISLLNAEDKLLERLTCLTIYEIIIYFLLYNLALYPEIL